MRKSLAFLLPAALVPVLALAAAAGAQRALPEGQAATRAALRQALAEQRAADERSERLEREAAASRDAADRTAREAAALAARIQQSEAGIAAAEARLAIAERERAALREALGREQQPVVRLTAALQQFSRRPVALAALQPGSIEDVVYLRAVLDSTVPRIRQRTAGLRDRLGESRRLRDEALMASRSLREEGARLAQRQQELAALENRQRVAARDADSTAGRQAARALVLGEQARDLDALVAELDRAGTLRTRLAALPGPLLRPARPEDAQTQAAVAAAPDASAVAPPSPYLLPVTGRTLAGFGARQGTAISNGLTLAPRPGAQVVAPASGRVAFAAPYRGYGRIVIVEHSGGWASLVTGLARIDVSVGDELIAGAPLGIAAQASPAVTLELRQGGEPVNPLPFVG